ncbi:pilus assembly PilX family protein [Vreelandella jeotgali]|uniref:pilus assembly PilX family protein n=1 Tax=Vreelandella jeotgali TaxID=553386 RepID=UPI00034624B0|nr:pilus assembly PilX N-terminal domain-containing protein [Halomonas jeotgali]
MKEQRGAALVIVMALLTGAMVVGVAGMQSTLVDERLAGNYSASVQAQMNAEQAAAAAAKDIKNNSYSESKTDDDLSEFNDGREGDNKVKTKEELRNISYSEAEAEAEEKDILLKKGKNCTGEENECFYFPIKIGEKKYWAAFGAVKKKDKLVSQHVVLVGLKENGDEDGGGDESSQGANNSFPGQDIINAFNKYGVLSDKKIEIEADNDKNIPFYGLIHTNKKNDEVDDLEVSLEGDKKYSRITTRNDYYFAVPAFGFNGFLDKVRSEFLPVEMPKDKGCDFSGNYELSEGKHYCADKVEVEESSSIKESDVYLEKKFYSEGDVSIEGSKVYFASKFEIDGSLSISNDSTVYFGDTVEIDGDFSIGGDVFVDEECSSKSTVYFDDKLDADAGFDISCSRIVVNDKIEIGDDDDDGGGFSLINAVVVSGKKIEIDAADEPIIKTALIMSGGKIDVEFENEARVNGGWFYSGKKIEMEIDESPNMEFCGGLIAKGKIDFEADPSIKKFYSSGYSEKCPEFSGFDGPLMDGAGKTGSGSVTWE